MAVEIDRMDTRVEVTPDTASSGGAAASAASRDAATAMSAADERRLRELLRPLVLGLLSDELSSYRRMRG